MYGKELVGWRRAAMLSQLELAQYIGVCRRTVMQWEHGRNKPHKRNEAKLLAATEPFDIYGPGSYAWDCADRIESGYLTLEQALTSAPTTYVRKTLSSWLTDVVKPRVHK